MKQILLIFFAICLLSSCVTSKRYQVILDESMSERVEEVKPTPDWLSVDFSENLQKGNLVEKKVFSAIPIIIFNSWKTEMDCNLDEEQVNIYTKNAIVSAADSLSLQEKLGGENLSIQLNAVPNDYTYKYSGFNVYVIITVVGDSTLKMTPIDDIFDVSYSINGNTKITFKTPLEEVEKNGNIYLKGPVKATAFYLDQYRAKIDKFAIELVEKIIEEIE